MKLSLICFISCIYFLSRIYTDFCVCFFEHLRITPTSTSFGYILFQIIQGKQKGKERKYILDLDPFRCFKHLILADSIFKQNMTQKFKMLLEKANKVLLIVILSAFLKNYPDMYFCFSYSLMRLLAKSNV